MVFCMCILGNGLLDFNEFMHMMETRASDIRRRSADAEMRALFTAFDKDGNGYIDASELKSTMRDVGLELTDRDIDVMMKVAGVAIKDRIFYEGLFV
jgi:Ca2+-binding EF-hand superfamily protein